MEEDGSSFAKLEESIIVCNLDKSFFPDHSVLESSGAKILLKGEISKDAYKEFEPELDKNPGHSSMLYLKDALEGNPQKLDQILQKVIMFQDNEDLEMIKKEEENLRVCEQMKKAFIQMENEEYMDIMSRRVKQEKLKAESDALIKKEREEALVNNRQFYQRCVEETSTLTQNKQNKETEIKAKTEMNHKKAREAFALERMELMNRERLTYQEIDNQGSQELENVNKTYQKQKNELDEKKNQSQKDTDSLLDKLKERQWLSDKEYFKFQDDINTEERAIIAKNDKLRESINKSGERASKRKQFEPIVTSCFSRSDFSSKERSLREEWDKEKKELEKKLKEKELEIQSLQTKLSQDSRAGLWKARLESGDYNKENMKALPNEAESKPGNRNDSSNYDERTDRSMSRFRKGKQKKGKAFVDLGFQE